MTRGKLERQSIDILYLIEHTARELDIACVIAHHLKEKFNLRVEIRSIAYNLWETISKFNPRFLVTPFCYSGKDYGIMDLRHHYPNLPIFSLNFEQVLSGSNEKFLCPRDDFSKNRVWHLAWDATYRNLLLSCGVSIERISVVGNPSFAFFLPQYAGLIPSRKELAKRFQLNPQKKWIFFPMNYAWAFLTEAEIQSKIDRGYDATNAKIYREFCLDSLSEVSKWWYESAQSLDVEMIIRPRPAVPAAAYWDHFKKNWLNVPKNVHVIKDLRVTDWAAAIDRAFTSFSTSIFQTLLVDRPSWIMEPLPFPDFLKSQVNEIVPALKSREAFQEAISGNGAWSYEMIGAKKAILDKWLPRGDPLQKLAEAIGLIYQNHAVELNENARTLKEKLSYQCNNWLQRSINKIKNQEQLPNRAENDVFSDDDVEKKLQHWAKII